MEVTRRALITGAVGIAAAATLSACTPLVGAGGAGGKATIRYTNWYGPGDIAIWKNVIAEFEKANPNISVKFEPVDYPVYFTKLNTEFAAGTAPDVMGMQFTQSVLGANGQLLELQDKMRSSLSKLPANLTAVGQAEKNGKRVQYAVPWHFVGASLYANMTAFDKAGIKAPKSWTLDDFVAAAKELTSGSAFGVQVPQGDLATSFESAFGAAPVSKDGKRATLDTAEMAETRAFLRDLIWKHKVAPQVQNVSTQTDPFATGAVQMAYGGSWNTPVYRQVKDLNFDVLANPSGKHPAKTYAGPDMMSVYSKSKNPDAAVKFVEFVTTNLAAQKLIAPTGLPVLKSYLLEPDRVQKEAAAKPANYAYFADQATNDSEGWAFNPAFSQIGPIVLDMDTQILGSPNSDIERLLKSANAKVQAAIDSAH